LDDLIVGAKYADLSDKLNTGKSYIIFGKTNTNAVNLIKLGDNSQYAIDYLARARLPAPVCSNAVILLALMRMLSVPKPALNTSMPPLPVKVSLPAPATKISSLWVPVSVLAFMIIADSQSPAQAMSMAMVWMI
jgi:hypothetical protein